MKAKKTHRIPHSSSVLLLAGALGSSISSCSWRVDQRKRCNEVTNTKHLGCSIHLFKSRFEDMGFLCRSQTKDIFNAQFGSLFRAYHNPTYFSRRLSRFADIYMASISCLLNYDLRHIFFPRRTPLQHESPYWLEYNPSGCSASSPAPKDQSRV